MNIVDLLQADGFELKWVAATYGGEYCGPCPRCSGLDRFRAWPESQNSKGGRFWCRGCGWSGDAIEYLKTFRQMRFREACDYLGYDLPTNPRRNSPHTSLNHKSKTNLESKEMQTPSNQWQSRGRAYLEGAIYNLWASTGYRWLGWLKEIRGLNEATIRTYKLGLQPKDRWEAREDWGLEKLLKENGKLKKLQLPEGLVIPYFIDDQISQISFRRKKSAGDPRYIHLEGSHSHPMVLHPERDILIVVESALDGFLLGQEAGDLAGVVILGSAQAQPDKELTAFLRRRRLILLALDADPPGAKARRWWLEKLPNSRRWHPIRGKDPGEMLEQGIDLRLWIEVGIARLLDEVTEIEEEENESLFSGSNNPAESQFQVSPSLGEAIGGQEYQAQDLFPEPLSEVVKGGKISQGFDGDGKPEPAAVKDIEHISLKVQPPGPEVARDQTVSNSLANEDPKWVRKIVELAVTGRLTEPVPISVKSPYQNILGEGVWFCPDQVTADNKSPDLAFIPEELMVIIPLLTENKELAATLLSAKRILGGTITDFSLSDLGLSGLH